jgi:hypothetical protein
MLTPSHARRAVLNFLDANPLLHQDKRPAYVHSLAPKPNAPLSFVVTFSRPRQAEPVPRAVALVEFYVTGTVEATVVSYRIENETTVRSDNGGLAFSKEWIDGVIKRKMKMKELFDCRSDFDRSRWEDIVE